MSAVEHILDLIQQAQFDYETLCEVLHTINHVLAENDLSEEAKNALLEIKNDLTDTLAQVAVENADHEINEQAAVGNLQHLQDQIEDANGDNPANGNGQNPGAHGG